MSRILYREGIGECGIYLDFQHRVAQAAKVDRPVIFVGERGTGKELAARRLHFLSGRWEGPLVAVSLASLPPTLVEAELFGYEKGAFTGAVSARKGRFEEAEGGTLFLDEIGLVPLEVQEKILRTVEYGTFERIGSSETRYADVRIVAATNADLPELAREGRFKEDLLDRLSFEVIFVPPLRARTGDIMLLANYFATNMAEECGYPDVPYFSPRAEKKLLSYSWPGNIRELKNTVERAVYRCEGGLIDDIETEPFRNPFEKPSEKPSNTIDLERYPYIHEEIDLKYLKKALDDAGGNQRRAAELLSLTYDQFRGLYRKLRDRLPS